MAPDRQETTERVAVLGAGAWGTALAVMLSRAGAQTTLCVRRPEMLAALAGTRENAAYLPGVELPAALHLTGDWATAARHAGLIVMAVPSPFARAAISSLASAIAPATILVSAVKGLEPDSLATMTAMMAREAPQARTAALSGPGFAAEIARGRPAALVAASSDEKVADAVQRRFASRTLRVYSSTDAAGVELAGAAKNVIAIAAGISDGLQLGASARAAVITRGLAEVMRLGAALGGRRETIAGLAGLGDLVLTCTGELSRNRALGLRIGRGEPVAVEASPGRSVAEGAVNAPPLKKLAARAGVEMPIGAAVFSCLYEGTAPQAIVEGLLSRELKAEF